ncbi:HAD family acid phosphatase [Nocardioides sp.]|uniref:HAD family acid phosphatase n=1 Tax=Nocardioides sp. TaxID=35761 RepID=UPI002F3E76D2
MKLSLRHSRPARTATIAIASAAAGMALAVPGLAIADHGHHSVPAPPANPTSANQIQNIDQVKTAIKAYYGDTLTTVNDPVPDGQDAAVLGDKATTQLHQFSPDSAYAHEVERIANRAGKALVHHHKKDAHKAILFDIDDTTLNTYSYEIYSNFVYNPGTNAYFVNAGLASIFPAVPGMVALEKKAIAHGYSVFFLTGRPISQVQGTLDNLTDAGYTIDPTHVYLKDATAQTEPWLSSCVVPAPTPTDPNATKFICTTIQYKSMTRQHIESLGYNIVANFGDQFSDLKGGFADTTYKIPNPMYFLP